VSAREGADQEGREAESVGTGRLQLDLDRPHDAGALSPDEQAILEAHAAAFVLGALEEDEAAPFERHLPICAFCRQVVQEFSGVVSELAPPAETVTASPGLRDRLLTVVREELAADQAGTGPAEPAEASSLAPPPRVGAATASPAPSRTSAPRRPFWRAWPASATGLAAALLVCALGLGTWNVILQRQVQAQAAALAQYEATLAAAARGQLVRIVALAPAGEGGHENPAAQAAQVALVVPAPGAEAAPRLVILNLPPPPTERSYQVWLIEQGRPVDAGTFRGAAAPVAVVTVHGDPARAQAVAITVEPLGGSVAPTTPPLLAAQL
jgi:anti-sigma-K factor RskA